MADKSAKHEVSKILVHLLRHAFSQWRTKVDKTTKTGYDKAVPWGTSGKVEKEWFTVRVSPFQFTQA